VARLELNAAQIRLVPFRFAKQKVDRVSKVMRDTAVARIPKKTGATARKAYIKSRASGVDHYTAEIGFRTIVALWLDRGTAPHQEPMSGYGRMSFYWEKVGHWVTLYHVNHPGIKGSRFLTDTLYIAKADGFDISINFGNLPT